MLNFSSMDDLLPDPQGDSDRGWRATLLGLYRGIVAALPALPPIIPGKGHKRKPRLTPPMLDFERVRLDRLAATEAKEAAMLNARIGVERANLRTIVASMATASDQQQRRLRSQIAAIEVRIKDLQMHLSKLKGGRRQ